MTHRPLLPLARAPLACAALLVLAGCGGSDDPAAKPTKGDQSASKPAAAQPASEAYRFQDVLAKADAADGTVDHVVAKCASCSLGMDGHADHSVELEGYTLQACSQRCAQRIKEKPEEVMASVAFTFDEE